jgi:hypothetical protein
MEEFPAQPAPPGAPAGRDAADRALSPWDDAWHEAIAARRRAVLRRLRVLLLLTLAGFTLITWMLVRAENPLAHFAFGPGPSLTVRRHLEALNRGELKTAYQLFSTSYREQVPFESYHQLVVTHWRMFHTQVTAFDQREAAAGRAVLDTHLVAADGERYLARFTMVRAEGRWWIDDLRWTTDSDPKRFLRA